MRNVSIIIHNNIQLADMLFYRNRWEVVHDSGLLGLHQCTTSKEFIKNRQPQRNKLNVSWRENWIDSKSCLNIFRLWDQIFCLAGNQRGSIGGHEHWRQIDSSSVLLTGPMLPPRKTHRCSQNFRNILNFTQHVADLWGSLRRVFAFLFEMTLPNESVGGMKLIKHFIFVEVSEHSLIIYET